MKRSYPFVSEQDVKDCKAFAKILINRIQSFRILDIEDAKGIEYDVIRFFGCTSVDFRMDFEEWIEKQIRKQVCC